MNVFPFHIQTVIAGAIILAAAICSPAVAQDAATYDSAELLEAGPLGDKVIGEDDAPVTIIEYASMTCPYCASFHENVYPQVKETYIDSGKARLIFREFPLDRLAAAASMLARCVNSDRFFPFIDILFKQQKTWVRENPVEALKKLAKQAGLSDEAFDKCLSNQELLDGIAWVQDRGKTEFNVSGTPSFFINGEFVSAGRAQDFGSISKIIDKHLGE